MTDSTGAVRARYSYDPFGRQTKVMGDLDTDFGYTGYFKHQASGLNLTLYRAYDPDLGRFLSRDPFGEKGSLNLYAYVGNNPLNGIDPLGLFLWTPLSAGEFFRSAGTGALQGAEAFADGANPFGNPFANNGFYDPCDSSLRASRHIGTATALVEGALGLGAGAFYAPGESIFYGGGNVSSLFGALELSEAGAGSTIFDTAGGATMQALGIESKTAWSVASWFYANTTGATATVVLGAGGGAVGTILGDVELPVLEARGIQITDYLF